MNKQEAKELCIRKWTYIVENNGKDNGLIEALPELSDMNSHCAYCELYYHTRDKKSNVCAMCPIKPEGKFSGHGCLQDRHPFNVWIENESTETAQAVLTLIKNS